MSLRVLVFHSDFHVVMRRFLLCIVILTADAAVSFAQKTRTVSDTYTYIAPKNISPSMAELNAVEQAKLNIIAQNFGTVIGVSNTSVTKVRNGNTNSQFVSFAESDVKGEWLETVGTPEIKTVYDNNLGLVVTVKIKGVIREVSSARTDLSVHVLRNSTDLRAETDNFFNGDDFFVYFLSPVDGYVSIYMYDMENVVRLWPKAGSGEGAQKVDAATEYVFFQGMSTPNGVRSLYYLTADADSDINRMYIVFSTRPYSHPNDAMMESFPVLSFSDFQSWLSKSRKSDYGMMVIPKDITINK